MFNVFKVFSVIYVFMFFHACSGSGNGSSTAEAPRQVTFIGDAVYEQLDANPALQALFASVGFAGGKMGADRCDVTLFRMSFDTVDGAGEATTSSGVFMMPSGDAEHCSGDRPTVLYAHGTNADSSYDLSQFIIDGSNPAAGEAGILLAIYASQGFAVIAPNYAGYADSTLGYHPYLIEEQQSTEMIDALNNVRDNVDIIGASLSDNLFVTGLSQGGYVAMATHKAMQEQGIPVTASLPISGPYTTLSFIDFIFSGTVNGGATTFAPMYINALQQSFGIYDDPSEVYASEYADIAEGALPGVGGLVETDFASAALFNADGAPLPVTPNGSGMDFGTDFLIADSFRATYLADAAANPTNPANPVRSQLADADLRDWSPSLSSPLMMCGANSDPVVFHPLNSDQMAEFWEPLVAGGLVINLDLDDTPAGPFAAIQGAWAAAAVPVAEVHGQTGVFCSLAGLGFFNQILAAQ